MADNSNIGQKIISELGSLKDSVSGLSNNIRDKTKINRDGTETKIIDRISVYTKGQVIQEKDITNNRMEPEIKFEISAGLKF